ncbi:helix-turn-helix transcriptional regulator [Robinsoniella peoriensis]|uniref:helix-turn-helix transcriptional regulator n=1 Tax=Robinsoniella peoriensis TaxID=180332 RepID=UPI00375317C4
MQIERLVQMVFYIVNREHVTAKELADHFSVSTRTIYRDINTLTLAGIPVTSSKGTGGGISLIDGYTINKSLFSKEEQQNIYQGLQILQASKYPNAETALSKIGSIFRNVLEPEWLEVDFSFWGSDEKQKVGISELQHAIINKHMITFEYINNEIQKSKRAVEPLRLVFKSHAWYIVGFCQSKRDIRIFRLSRMKHIRVTPEVFERELPTDYLFAYSYKEKINIPAIKLKCYSEIVGRVYDDFLVPENEVLACTDGSYMITVQNELDNWLFDRLLSYGKYVEVIEPEEARTMIKEKALEIAGLYD